METLLKSTMTTSMVKISVRDDESMCIYDGSNGLYACISMMSNTVHMSVCLSGLCVLDVLHSAIQPFSVVMYK